ncbi:MAG: hypothetical protein ACOYMD_00925 [Paludibacter sp.]
MEIGSFIELDLKKTGEYFKSNQIARLNSGRAGIFYSLQLLGVSKIYIPYYQCPSVFSFLEKKGIEIARYYLDSKLMPQIDSNEKDTAVLIVNYFGLFDSEKLIEIAAKFINAIIDNSQAFYTKPIENLLNIYSPRKFFGVPDGCYVIGNEAKKNEQRFEKDFSSATSGFLLKRIEMGCNAVYSDRQANEERIEQSDVMQMSQLTQYLLLSIDYEIIKKKRLANFRFAHKLFKKFNMFNIEGLVGSEATPMVYPLLIEQEDIVSILKDNNIYTGRWWAHVLQSVDSKRIEHNLSKYMIPIPIDQRYGEKELNLIYSIIAKNIK